ncbi:MAG: protein kinase [Acidobacteria bacterium]|nr:protein kinase [Acidobacteriota bacterium]
MSPEAGQMLSHYRLIDEIGRGGMGVVYRALDTSLDRHVAVKVLPPEVTADTDRLERFRREAKAIAALNHPGIVTIHSVEESGGVHFLTMELVQGRTLDTVIPPAGLPLARFFEVAVQLADAVSAAHERGVVHRDLKPANVMVIEGAAVKVLDFGLAKLRKAEALSDESTEPTRTVTQEGRLLGTVPYMSPEQIQGRPADHRSDLFALGIILYEMATGKRPFRGESPADVASSILRDTPAGVTDLRAGLPAHLGQVIRRCLEKDPARRYQTAVAVRNELEDLQSTIASGAAPAVPSRKRRKAVVAAGAAAALLISVFGYVLWQRSGGHAPPASGGPGPEAAASIAILPFENMSADKENEYFSDGITEELINALVKVQGLKVPARTSVFALKGKDLSIQEIGRTLGVGTVLEGSVRKSGDRIRITAQLINVADGYHLWSERYDREMKDVFAVQDEISQNIVRALRVTLSPREERAIRGTPTSDTQAYDYYLRGRRVFHLSGRRNWGTAREMFSRAIAIDPGYALAYAGIADTSAFLYMYAESTDENLERSRSASQKALELAPDLAEAHASRGLALSLTRQYEEADREFETAIRLDPKLFEAYYFYARDCWVQGKHDKAAPLFEKAFEVRPEDYQAPILLAGVYVSLGRPVDAQASMRRALSIIQARLETHPEDVRALYLGAGALVGTGQVEQGLEWADRALAIEPKESGLLYNVACVYSTAGRTEEAIGLLERAIEAGFAQKEWIENDSDLDSLRDHPRFKALLRKMRAARPAGPS